MISNIGSYNAIYYAGLTLIANELGHEYLCYRPATANDPLAAGNQYDDTLINFDAAPDFAKVKMKLEAHPVMYASWDASSAQVGDFLVAVDTIAPATEPDKFLVIQLADLQAPMTVECNALISFYKPDTEDVANTADPNADYSNYESGNTANQGKGTPYAMNWPCSLIQGTKGEKAQVSLPTDTRDPWAAVICAAPPGVIIETDDLFFDENGDRWEISNPEKTAFGYRLTAEKVTA